MVLSRRLWWACLVFIFMAGVAAAQPQTGRIEGRVVKDDKGVGGVTVLINETKAVAFTEEDGSFKFEGVRPGILTLIFSLGENLTTQPQVDVKAGETTELEVEVDWEVVYESVRVTAAARRAEKIVDAPSAVTSVPEEEIEREASHGQLPKVLEFSPGAEVTQSGVYDFNFNTRGFNSSLNRRVATYVDGRDVGVPLLGSQEWAALSIPLDDLAGLEFVRGPSAALYGANASAGVINMTTKAPRDTIGGFIRLTAGELSTLNIDFRQASELGGGWFYKVTAGARNSGDFTLSRDGRLSRGELPPDPYDPPVPYCEFPGESDCLIEEKPLFRKDNNHIRFGTVRADKYFGERLLTIEASATEVRGPAFLTGVGRVQIRDASRPFGRINFSTPRWTVLGSYARRDGNQANLARRLRGDTFELYSDTIRMAAEAQYNNSFGQNDQWRLVVGGAYTYEDIDSKNANGRQTVIRDPIDSHREAIFAQIDWKATSWLKLVGAGRVDQNTLHDTQFSPKLAAVFNLTPTQTIRTTFNKAFQVANYSEFYLNANLDAYDGFVGIASLFCNHPNVDVPLQYRNPNTGQIVNPGQPFCLRLENSPIPPVVKAVGNPDLTIEKTTAWEVGYSGIIARRLFVTLDYYRNNNTDFISDLLPQAFTRERFDPDEPLQPRLNPNFPEWVGTVAAQTSMIQNPPPFPGLPAPPPDAVADSIGRSVRTIFEPLGVQFALDPDTDEAIFVARTYENIGEVDTQGVDFGVNWFVNDRWNIRASYSWFDFEIVGSGGFDLAGLTPLRRQEVLDENVLPNTPASKASMSISYTRDRWDASVSSRWVDEFRWNAGLFQGPVPAYTLVDIAATLRFGERFKVGLNGSNVLDNEHYQAFGGDVLTRRVLAYSQVTW